MRRLSGAIALAIALAAAGMALAAAEPPAGDPPPPRALNRGDVEDWVARYIQPGTFLDSGQTDSMVLFYDPATVELAGDKVRAGVRGELFETQPFRTAQMRSFRDRWDFDCADKRFLIGASDVFPQSNLQGAPIVLDTSKEQWSRSFGDGSGPAPLIAQVCSIGSILRSGADKAKAMPPPPAEETDEATQAWVKRYVDAGQDTLAYAGRGLAVLYSVKDMGEADGHPLASVRTELTRILPADDTAWRSMREKVEVDCAGRRYLGVRQEIYPGSNLTGAAVVNTEGDWTDVTAASVGAKWFPSVCAALHTPAPPAPAPGSI